MIYLIGSLRNPRIPLLANALRSAGFEVFDDWFAAGPEADDKWQEYERGRGHNFIQALNGWHARHVFDFDKTHLDWADAAVLVLPAGKSAHLELGYVIGSGRPGFVYMEDEPERFDVMYRFAKGVAFDVDGLIGALKRENVR